MFAEPGVFCGGKDAFKAFVAVYLVTHTFDITMAVFDMAQHVVSGAAGVIGGSTEIDVAAALSSMQSGLDAMEIPELLLLVMEAHRFQSGRFDRSGICGASHLRR